MKLLLVSFLALSFSPLANAEDHAKDHGKGDPGSKMIQMLGLNKDQQEKFRSLHKEYRPKMEALRKSKMEKHEKVSQAFVAETNEKELQSIHDELVEIEKNIHNLKWEKWLKIRKLLNKEQRTTFLEMSHGKGRHGGKNRGKHGAKHKD